MTQISGFLGPPVQHVAEASLEPCLISGVIVLWIDRLVVHVRKVATQARDLLHEPALGVGHQILIALIPQLVTTRDCSRDTAAACLDGVFCDEFGLEWRQLAMPVNNPGLFVMDGRVHFDPCDQPVRAVP